MESVNCSNHTVFEYFYELYLIFVVIVIFFLQRAELRTEEHCSRRPLYNLCEEDDVTFLKNLLVCLNPSNASSSRCHSHSIIPHY